MDEKTPIRCAYCGKTLAIYFASNGKHFCDETHKELEETRVSLATCRSQGIIAVEASSASHQFQLGNE